ncbi:polysaccharide deacetylase family protein [Bordetella hinzii]|uniref:Polysaccharide deacetylase n=1 Tax=Bordetella hinzii OH87 BAL007II TaxID=1331262 RepID=A0ABR4QW48_9BORD|nr:polysaccharide deacetylase family protein [Bordetella hinzii]KCB21672.1 polysaccharide deacetylase [Bordetella hinzii OH87 BAL007II]KCB32305.1 polysaccharide deacetylase [Bordetella hinzii CA90 BAL1384]KCB40423.1 polysaccharide deacetylase [Bordetella hinzii 5132]
MNSFPILMYHQIGIPAPSGTPYRGLTVHPARFRSQMTWMHRLGYRGLSMRDLMPYLRGEKTGKVFGVTFDDGYRNVLENAAPVLAELGFTGTNYFVARQLDGSNVWDAEKGIPYAGLMSAAEMRQWHEAGNEVGSHTLDHVHLPRLPADEARRQIRQSKDELEQALGAPVTAFCYPYGDHGPEHMTMVREAGYDNATLTVRGLACAADDPFGLPRVTVSRSTHLLSFLLKTLTRYEACRRR